MKILLVSDNQKFADDVRQKLVFLRQDDAVIISDYSNAVNNAAVSSADVILVHENDEQTFELIRELRKNKSLCIILLANSNNAEYILQAYDCGIDDFALSSAEDFELVVRIVNNIKHNSVKNSAMRNERILQQLNVTDELTGIYNHEYCKQVIENYIDDNLLSSGIFMAVSPNEASKMSFSVENFADAIKKSVRVNDIICKGRGINFYILLGDADLNGAIVVLNKIKENSGFDVCAGICEISSKGFEIFEKEAQDALAEALATDAEYIFAKKDEETLDEWLEEPAQKGYKIFRQMFNKKLEKVITPVFYRLQKSWEEKLFNTKIEQLVNEEQCLFALENKKQKSSLKIVYPGFAQIIIYIVHEGLDSPENNEIRLSLSKITQSELIAIVENFIKEFKETSL